MLIFFKHSRQKGLEKDSYHLILFNALLTDYVLFLLFQIVLLLDKITTFLFRFKIIYILCHMCG